MSLTLTAVTLNEQPLSQPITAVFDARGGTIGRADHNTMALPDPQRHVSRLQAEVVAQGDGFLIRNVGNANPIAVGKRSLGPGESTALASEDSIRIGGYVLSVIIGTSALPTSTPTPTAAALRAAAQREQGAPLPAQPAAEPAAAPLTPFPAVAITTPASPSPAPAPAVSTNPFADLLGPSTRAGPASGGPGIDPFADLLGSAPSPATAAAPAQADPLADFMPAPAGIDARSAAIAPAPPPVARLPDDFDPFATAPAPPRAPAAAPPPSDPFADLLPVADRSNAIDAVFGLGTAAATSGVMDASGDDPLAHFLARPAPTAGQSGTLPDAGMSVDPLALFGDAPAAIPASAPAQPDHLPAVHAAWQAPRVQAPSAPPAAPSAPAAPRQAAASVHADDAALWAAFCAGAGIDPQGPGPDPVTRMREAGRILRSAIDGTLQLIAVRASTKHELRAGVTVIQQRGNNPLKFSPDGKSGLEQLMQPPMRGFLDGPAAMDDAMHDLVGHAIGTVAGLRAAVAGMLERFAPEALQAKLTHGSMLDNLLPMNRKARLWDLYLQHHEAICEEAQEDFHTLFGKAFLAAYEQQIERLQRDARSGP